MTVLLESHYLPCLAYFSSLHTSSEIMLEKHEYFVKQSYRNRCYINTSQGRAPLIIPLTAKHGKVLIKDVCIDYDQKWLNNHWRTIVSAYNNAPFFEFYADDLHRLLFTKYKFLYDLNFNSLSLCLKWLKTSIVIKETLAYEKNYAQEVHDYRSLINPKKTEYLEKFYKVIPYYQVFGNSFVENLSIIDLIFCCGPEAACIIRSSKQ